MSVNQSSSGASGLDGRWSLLGVTILASPLRAHGHLCLYPGTLHQPPDPVNPALLYTISHVEMDLAIAINATGLQLELFDLSCQSGSRLMPW